MKQILTALFVITASVATAGGEGRYITVILDHETFMVTDTKLGKVRLCMWRLIDVIGLESACEPWMDLKQKGCNALQANM